MKFDLYFPTKPLQVNQRFGINGEYYQKAGINIIGHNGIDFWADHGQPIYASHGGVVDISKDYMEGWGVTITTTDLYEYKGEMVKFKTIYWHMCDPIKEPKYKFKVFDGQVVKAGDLLGYADNTGFSAGHHLHFGLKPVRVTPGGMVNVEQENGYMGSIDPWPYFNGFYAQDAQEVIETQLKLVISLYQQIINVVKRLIK